MIDFDYKVVRTSRRSMCVAVAPDNTVEVKCPSKASDEAILKFLETKSGWIKTVMARNSVKNEQLKRVLAFECVLVKGVEVKLVVDRKLKKEVFSPELVAVKNLKSLKNLYIENVGPEFLKLLEGISAERKLKCGEVSFRAYSSRWGCCDANKNIKFNYKLLMLEEKYWRYVISHELCHTVHLNHSKNFHMLLWCCMPDYRKVKKQLSQFSALCRLY